jgi:hypothetical protein
MVTSLEMEMSLEGMTARAEEEEVAIVMGLKDFLRGRFCGRNSLIPKVLV